VLVMDLAVETAGLDEADLQSVSGLAEFWTGWTTLDDLSRFKKPAWLLEFGRVGRVGRVFPLLESNSKIKKSSA
jgi:hypothetical protein